MKLIKKHAVVAMFLATGVTTARAADSGSQIGSCVEVQVNDYNLSSPGAAQKARYIMTFSSNGKSLLASVSHGLPPQKKHEYLLSSPSPAAGQLADDLERIINALNPVTASAPDLSDPRRVVAQTTMERIKPAEADPALDDEYKVNGGNLCRQKYRAPAGQAGDLKFEIRDAPNTNIDNMPIMGVSSIPRFNVDVDFEDRGVRKIVPMVCNFTNDSARMILSVCPHVPPEGAAALKIEAALFDPKDHHPQGAPNVEPSSKKQEAKPSSQGIYRDPPY